MNDENTNRELEAAVLRRLLKHLDENKDVQNIDLMIAGGFCRNCLGRWYAEAAGERGIDLTETEARKRIYGRTDKVVDCGRFPTGAGRGPGVGSGL